MLATILAIGGMLMYGNSEPHPADLYLDTLTSGYVAQLAPAPVEEQLAAAYRQLIEDTYFALPVGVDCWRWRQGDSVQLADYLTLRAISPLAFGIGSCEDYAAAMVAIAEELGLPARYIPGIALSVDGAWVDHAWAAVCLDGRWYHLDPQLEDNITRNDRLNWRYWLRTDAEMMIDHRWGSSLIETAALTDAQREEITAKWLFTSSVIPLPRRAPVTITPAKRPSRTALMEELAAERIEYEAVNGALPARTVDITPLLFGNAGYGPPD